MESQNSLVILNELSVADNLITVRRCRKKLKVGGRQKGGEERGERKEDI